MASVNNEAGQLALKIVYYGPSFSGKTANLRAIHRKTVAEQRGDMVPVATETDQTHFCDYMPLDIGKVKGFDVRFEIYTVPGEEKYTSTRKNILQGVDGVVFVADSGEKKISENIESFHDLENNLAAHGYEAGSIPIFIQYNKRDLPDSVNTSDLNRQINIRNLPHGEAVAIKGVGVFEAFKKISTEVIDKLSLKGG